MHSTIPTSIKRCFQQNYPVIKKKSSLYSKKTSDSKSEMTINLAWKTFSYNFKNKKHEHSRNCGWRTDVHCTPALKNKCDQLWNPIPESTNFETAAECSNSRELWSQIPHDNITDKVESHAVIDVNQNSLSPSYQATSHRFSSTWLLNRIPFFSFKLPLLSVS